MPKFNEVFTSKYTKEQIYNMVLDIEKYPDFLPWCGGTRILESDGTKIIAEMIIRFESFSESYTSLVTFDKPNTIFVKQTSGPFKILTNKWEFETNSDNTTKIMFEIEFKFKSKILEKLIGTIFEKASKKLTKAFIDRADTIYS